jgi:hypothetical protein
MTPDELKEIQTEVGLTDAEFASALSMPPASGAAEPIRGTSQILPGLAERAERLLDDHRYARLILERKIQPQFEELLASGEKPARIALITQLDRDSPEHRDATKAETRFSIYKQLDKLARVFFESRQVEVVSKVEFIAAPEAKPGEETPAELSVLDVRVEAL